VLEFFRKAGVKEGGKAYRESHGFHLRGKQEKKVQGQTKKNSKKGDVLPKPRPSTESTQKRKTIGKKPNKQGKKITQSTPFRKKSRKKRLQVIRGCAFSETNEAVGEGRGEAARRKSEINLEKKKA